MYWFAGFLGVCMIAAWPHVRHLDLGLSLNVARDECSDRFARNAILLSSGLCDRGTHELEMGDLVRCDKARRETAWGMTACIVSARLADSVFASLSASWTFIAVATFLASVCIRGWFSSRAEVQKHAMSIEANQRMMQQHTAGFLQSLPPLYQQQHQQYGWSRAPRGEEWQRLRQH